ncbi:nucleoside phosphorylase domain-containing protein [Aspergillus nidulans var. acristatus]
MASCTALDSPDFYAIAWIAALPIERAAAEAMLDEEHATPIGFTRHQTDANIYTLLASLPSIRVGLLVGIGGGIARPDEDRDIRLGDVVVSQPSGTMGGVCQYDLIKAKLGDKRERTGFLGRPPTVLLNALSSIQAYHEQKDSKVSVFLQVMLEKNPKMGKKSKQNPGYVYQGSDNDRLFKASYDHVPGPDCRGCDTSNENAITRDQIVADLGEDCICVEMEAASLMNHFPCLVIRGICDYADSHKNNQWKRYALATAAAYAKELLGYVPGTEVQETKRALEVLQLG